MNTLRNLLWIVTAGLLFWLIGLGTILSVAGLLDSLGDVSGASVLRYIGLGVGILAILDLLIVVVVLALLHLVPPNDDA